MNKHKQIIDNIISHGFLPLFYNDSVAKCIAITKALYEGGVRCIEFTNRGAKALENFKSILELKNNGYPDLLVGIGTIKTALEAKNFTEAGADYLVSPFFNQGVSDYANAHQILWIPGSMTPGEIQLASANGHHFIKLFPGNILTPSFIKTIKPLFPEDKFMVTGGVSTEENNLKSWFSAGAAAVGLGSNLIKNENDYTALAFTVKEAKILVDKVRG